MQVQFTVYDGPSVVFVEAIPRARKIPRIGETVHFPDCDQKDFATVLNVVYHMYRDGDPLIEVICQVCIEPKCKDKDLT